MATSTINALFPCSERNDADMHGSRLLTEGNITNILKAVTDYNSFVIKIENKEAEFVIDGYYLDITNDVIAEDNCNAYLRYNTALKEIAWDGNNTILIQSSDPENPVGDITYKKLELKKNGKICNLFKLKEESLDLVAPKYIKCGELTR